MKHQFSIPIVLAVLLSRPLSALATSFDCSQLLTAVEQMICSDAELSQLDDKLANAYKATKSRAPTSTRLASDQRQWLAGRDACTDRQCIRASYETRLRELTA